MRRPAAKVSPRPSLTEHGLVPFQRTLVSQVAVDIPFHQVERAIRLCLDRLVKESSIPARRATERDAVCVWTRRWPRLFRVIVDVEVSGAYGQRPGMLAHLHWHARRHGWLLPVMEADLLARPEVAGQTRLALEATYHPPFGIAGLAWDVLIGRVIARSTLVAFTDRLVRALGAAVSEGGCDVGALAGARAESA